MTNGLTNRIDRLRQDYVPAFLRYLSQREERALRAAYELGRAAVVNKLSLLDLTQIHHTVLLEVLQTTRTSPEIDQVTIAASEFLVEVLATFEMTQRGFLDYQADATQTMKPAASDDSTVIEQAKGILMERYKLSSEKASNEICRRAKEEQLPVREVALRLIQSI
jgi:hypothetical protein